MVSTCDTGMVWVVIDSRFKLAGAQTRTGGYRPLVYAVAVHVVLLIFLGVSIRWSWKEDIPVMQARVVDSPPPKKKAAPKPEPEKKTEDKKKLAEKKEQADLKKKQDALAKKKAQEKKKKQEEERRRREQAEKALQESLEAEEAERVEAERRARAATLIDQYKALIRQKVSRNWAQPGGSRRDLKCVVRVRLLASGEVLEARVIKSSGDSIYDRSVESAVHKASPLPLPKNTEYFDYFREIEFTFNPED